MKPSFVQKKQRGWDSGRARKPLLGRAARPWCLHCRRRSAALDARVLCEGLRGARGAPTVLSQCVPFLVGRKGSFKNLLRVLLSCCLVQMGEDASERSS